jgi:hypothetical protein
MSDLRSSEPKVGFYLTKRIGGAVADSRVIKLLKFSASQSMFTSLLSGSGAIQGGGDHGMNWRPALPFLSGPL